MKIVLVALLAAVAAIGANFALLGYANGSNDPVGRLTPRVSLPETTTSTSTTTTETGNGDDDGGKRRDGPDDD
jgi:hypothetical protein